MKKIVIVTLWVVWMFVLAGCRGSTAAPEGVWRLISLNGAPVLEGGQLTIEFKKGDQVSGASGCNSFGGGYQLSGASLDFSNLAMTLMACADAGVMQQESAYLAALEAVDTIEVGETSLILSGPGTELVYER